MNRLIRERVQTVILPTGSGPAAVKFETFAASHAALAIRAWQGQAGVSNVYLFETVLSLAQCQQKLTDSAGQLDGVCLAGSGGPVEWRPDQDVSQYTVFFEANNASGQTQAVTIVVVEGFYDS